MIEISIIIPFQGVTAYLHETLSHIGLLKKLEFEVILLPDEPLAADAFESHSYPIVILPTGPVSPAIKRDQGANASRGKYLAFIDDDAYPSPNWLEHSIGHFQDDRVAAVGGPQVTPEEDSFWQKVSGAMFLSPLNGGAVDRYWPGKKTCYVDDWPSVNLIVTREDFLAVDGFDSSYWPGEDTKFCLDLIKKQGKRIVYEPKAIVFHHRRAGFFKHMKQVGNYGLHRGFFAKKYPETSFKLPYFMPSLFFLFVCTGWSSFLMSPVLGAGYIGLWWLYLMLICVSTLMINARIKDFRMSLATIPFLIGTHFWYGWCFIKGFVLVKDLKSKLGR